MIDKPAGVLERSVTCGGNRVPGCGASTRHQTERPRQHVRLSLHDQDFRSSAILGDQLTVSELRVARFAAEPENREIAQSLFVSKKTVEMHLRYGYQTLGITSRSEPPEALERDG